MSTLPHTQNIVIPLIGMAILMWWSSDMKSGRIRTGFRLSAAVAFLFPSVLWEIDPLFLQTVQYIAFSGGMAGMLVFCSMEGHHRRLAGVASAATRSRESCGGR